MMRCLVTIVICAVVLGAAIGIYFGVDGNRAKERNWPTGHSDSATILPTTSYQSRQPSSPVSPNSPNSSPSGQSSVHPSQSPNSFGPVGCIKTPIESYFDTPQETHQSINIEKDVVYGKGAVSGGEKELKLDIYHPSLSSGTEKYPLMIHIHGGSFISGSKDDGYITDLSYYWATQGFVVASINYRLMGDSPVVSEVMRPVSDYTSSNLSEIMQSRTQNEAATCAVEDTLLAYDYLSGLSYVEDTVVVVNGYSAGAITSMWATYGVPNFNITRPPVKAVISHWGLLLMDQEETNRFVTGDEPPAFLIHATGDPTVPYDGTQYVANRMESLGLTYALHCEESGAHAIAIGNKIHTNDMSVLEAERVWLRNILYWE